MSIVRNRGRIAGLIYLFVVLIAPLRLVVIPGRLFVHGNAEATAANLAAHESLFRLGMVSDLVSGIAMVFLVLALYRAFAHVNKPQGVLMVILGGPLMAATDFISVLNDAAALALIRSDEFLAVFSVAQRHALAYFFLRLHSYEVTADELIWGLWLFPLAVLIYQSRLVPRFFAYWLTLNGLAYVVTSLAGLLAPQYDERIATICTPLQLGEVAFMLWLIVRGVQAPSVAETNGMLEGREDRAIG